MAVLPTTLTLPTSISAQPSSNFYPIMSDTGSLLRNPSSRILINRLRRQESIDWSGARALHFDPVSRTLVPWLWYVALILATIAKYILTSALYYYYRPVDENGARVPPSDLYQYRNTHDFRFPCCICPASQQPPIDDQLQAAIQYKEARVFREQEGPYSSEWVAVCVAGACEYFRKFFYSIQLCRALLMYQSCSCR
jgi:hypothetical protein